MAVYSPPEDITRTTICGSVEGLEKIANALSDLSESSLVLASIHLREHTIG
jgi:hypothetical protein